MNRDLPQRANFNITKATEEQLRSAPALRTLAKLSFEQLDENYTPTTPHEAMAISLVQKALEGDSTAIRVYWDMQKQILQLIGKNNQSNMQFNIKGNNALSIALDNIGAKVLDGKVVDEKE